MKQEIKKELFRAIETYKPINANWFIFEEIINKAIQKEIKELLKANDIFIKENNRLLKLLNKEK